MQLLDLPVDILYLIFDQLKSTKAEESTALARSCRVSKSFHQPAASALWRSLYSIQPLLSLLSSFRKLEKSAGSAASLHVSKA